MTTPSRPDEPDQVEEGGDPACWLSLVCPECGAVTTEGHRTGCQSEPPPPLPGPS